MPAVQAMTVGELVGCGEAGRLSQPQRRDGAAADFADQLAAARGRAVGPADREAAGDQRGDDCQGRAEPPDKASQSGGAEQGAGGAVGGPGPVDASASGQQPAAEPAEAQQSTGPEQAAAGQSGRAPCGAVAQPSGQPVTQGGGGQTAQGQVIRVATGQVVRLDVEGLELLPMRPAVGVGESPSVVAEPGQRAVVSGEPAGGAGSSAGQPAGPEQSSGQGVQVGRERPDETAARTPAVESQGQGSARGEVRSGGPDGGGDSDRPEQAGQRQDSSARPHSPVGNTAGRLAELIRGAAAGEMLEQDGASVKRLEQSGVRAERGDAAGLIESRAGQQSWAAGRASAEVRGEPLARVDRPGSGEPVQQGRLTEQIVRVVRASLGQMRSQVHLRLSPPELGTLRLEIDLRADALRMRVVTETDAAGKALISRLEQLREALQQHSIRLERVEFEPRRPGADSAARPQDRPALAYGGQQEGSFGQTARGWSSMWDEPEGLEYAAQSAVPEANELSAAVESLVDVVV